MPKIRFIVLEGLVLASVGLAFALAANQLSPRGLVLTRDYFGMTGTSHPRATPPPVAGSPANKAEAPAAGLAELKARLEAKGIRLIDDSEAETLYRDPRYEPEFVIFIDARNDQHYTEGHVPGSYQFDRYYPEKYLAEVLPACFKAESIVVYCTGGKCEDSEFAAVFLADAGVPAGKIAVYAGGITDWTRRKLPIEIGARRSGNIKTQ